MLTVTGYAHKFKKDLIKGLKDIVGRRFCRITTLKLFITQIFASLFYHLLQCSENYLVLPSER